MTDIIKMKDAVVEALEDIKGFDITVLDVSEMTSLTHYMIICSANSNRQTRALADNVRKELKEQGHDIRSVEGEGSGDWVLVDLDDIIVHIMIPTARAHYNLEQLWGEAEAQRSGHITQDKLKPTSE